MIPSESDYSTVSFLRLFLSVDIEGSSALKTTRNHETLLRIYKDSRESINQWLLLHPEINKSEIETWLPVMLSSFSEDEWNWASIIARRFEDFHVMFSGKLSSLLDTQKECNAAESANTNQYLATNYVWKLLGDELIYSFEIKSRQQLHSYVSNFLEVLQETDKTDIQEKRSTRIKGSGWVAGFPVRNRVVALPAPQLYCMDQNGNYCLNDYPRLDYLGPEMDAGFRIGKFAHPGLMVVSFELADLLGQAETRDQVKGAIVGWEVLKGVWREKHYPIIWITGKESPDEHYDCLMPWSHMTNHLAREWLNYRSRGSLQELKRLGATLEETRQRLSPSLTIVAPYIPDELVGSSIPEDHITYLDLLKLIPNADNVSSHLGEDNESPVGDNLLAPEKVEKLLE